MTVGTLLHLPPPISVRRPVLLVLERPPVAGDTVRHVLHPAIGGRHPIAESAGSPILAVQPIASSSLRRFLRRLHQPSLQAWRPLSLTVPRSPLSALDLIVPPPSPLIMPLRRSDDLNEDLLRALGGESAAQVRLAERIARAWKFYPSVDAAAARDAVRLRAQSTVADPREVLQQEVLAALILVLADCARPQPIRLGNRHLGGPDGEHITPRELPVPDFWRWLRSRVVREARQSVLDFTGVGLRRPLTRLDAPDACLLASADPDPLDICVSAETLVEAWQLATPGERRVLTHLGAGYTPLEAAQQLGRAYSTVRQQLYRLRKRLAQRASW